MTKLKTCVITATKDELINVISSQSNRYGDKLIDFMDTYGLINLQQATVQQLREYVSAKCCLCAQKNTDDQEMEM